MSDLFRIAADIADAVDPAMTGHDQQQAARRAIRRDPELTAHLVVALARGLIQGLAERAGGPDDVMGGVRKLLGTMPDPEAQP